MRPNTWWIVLHVALLLLACTDFAPFGLLTGNGTFNFFAYAYASGWGYAYVSNYSLAQCLAYALAYGVGAYAYLRRRDPVVLRRAGVAVCAAGGASFSFEATHWFVDHHTSLIASAPVAAFALAAWALARDARHVRDSRRTAIALQT